MADRVHRLELNHTSDHPMPASVAYADEKGDYTRQNRMPRRSLHANRLDYAVDVLIVMLASLMISAVAWLAAAKFGVPCGPCRALGSPQEYYTDALMTVIFCGFFILVFAGFLGRALWRLGCVTKPFF